MAKMVRLILILFLMGLSGGCNKIHKEVIHKNEKGDPLLEYYVSEKDGKKERVKEKRYYDDGKIQYEGSFKNEKPVGEWKYYYTNGMLFAKGTFNQSGKGDQWSFYDLSGKEIHPKSVIEVILLSENNTPVIISFKEGERKWEYQLFNNFKPRSIGEMLYDKKDGDWTFWFENGNIQTKGTFKDDLQIGEQVVYFENGNVCYKGRFDEGKRIGEWLFFDKNGKHTGTQFFTK